MTPGYLEALGVSLVSGRLITREDRDGAVPVVVVSETLAREAWPGEDPAGKRVRRRVAGDAPAPWLTVVGVVKDVKEDRFGFRIARAVWYVPYAQQPPLQFEPPLNLLVRSKSEPAQLTPAIRRAIRAIDPHLPVSNVTTLSAHVGGVMSTERFSAIITGALALSGLALAAIGLYGVIAFSVSQRTNEIGVRVALGAGRFDILRLVMGRALGLVGVGLTVGLVGARLLADRFARCCTTWRLTIRRRSPLSRVFWRRSARSRLTPPRVAPRGWIPSRRSGNRSVRILAEAARAGGSIVRPAQRAPWGGGFGYFSDRDVYLWKVASGDGPQPFAAEQVNAGRALSRLPRAGRS